MLVVRRHIWLVMERITAELGTDWGSYIFVILYDRGVGLFNQLVIIGGEIAVASSVPINTGTELTISLSGSTYYCSI